MVLVASVLGALAFVITEPVSEDLFKLSDPTSFLLEGTLIKGNSATVKLQNITGGEIEIKHLNTVGYEGCLINGESAEGIKSGSGGEIVMYYGQVSTCDYDDGGINSGRLVSPSIDLSGVSGANLNFKRWAETECGGFCNDGSYDNGYVEISVNGGEWQRIISLCSGSMSTWVQSTVNLSNYVGNNVRIGFVFETGDDTYNNYPGWYLDDIQVIETSSNPLSLAQVTYRWVQCEHDPWYGYEGVTEEDKIINYYRDVYNVEIQQLSYEAFVATAMCGRPSSKRHTASVYLQDKPTMLSTGWSGQLTCS